MTPFCAAARLRLAASRPAPPTRWAPRNAALTGAHLAQPTDGDPRGGALLVGLLGGGVQGGDAEQRAAEPARRGRRRGGRGGWCCAWSWGVMPPAPGGATPENSATQPSKTPGIRTPRTGMRVAMKPAQLLSAGLVARSLARGARDPNPPRPRNPETKAIAAGAVEPRGPRGAAAGHPGVGLVADRAPGLRRGQQGQRQHARRRGRLLRLPRDLPGAHRAGVALRPRRRPGPGGADRSRASPPVSRRAPGRWSPTSSGGGHQQQRRASTTGLIISAAGGAVQRVERRAEPHGRHQHRLRRDREPRRASSSALLALALTLGAVVFIIVAIVLVAVAPVVLDLLGPAGRDPRPGASAGCCSC